jgi:hypothetical protein
MGQSGKSDKSGKGVIIQEKTLLSLLAVYHPNLSWAKPKLSRTLIL